MIFPILLPLLTCTQVCEIDTNCWSKSRPDIHSLFCVNSSCQKILGAGAPCKKPTDCASFYYYGPLACSRACKTESSCTNSESTSEKFCCRAVPIGGSCIPTRPSLLNGCEAKQHCVMNESGTFQCASNNTTSWIYGAVLSVSGNIAISLGINLQKKSYGNARSGEYFLVGSVIYGIAKVAAFSAYIFGNQSLLASLSASGLVANSIFAPLINHEIFGWKDGVAICLVLIGSSVIVANAGRSSKAFSLCELLKMYLRPTTMIWFGFLICILITFFGFAKFVENNSDWSTPNDLFTFLRRENVFFEDTGQVLRYVMLLVYVSISAIIAVFTSLFAKSFGEMLDRTISGDNQFRNSMTYLFFVLVVSFTFFQIYWLNRALRHYDALLTLPLFHAIWTVMSIFNAGIYFSDFEFFSVNQIWLFVVGLLIIFGGSLVLGSRIYDKEKVSALPSNVEVVTVKKK